MNEILGNKGDGNKERENRWERMKTDDARVGEEEEGVGRWPVAGQRRGEVEALDDWVIC